jgi:hypothetical protein
MSKEIPLTKGKVAIVDDEDFEELSKYKWRFSSTEYAVRHTTVNGKKCQFRMHRVVMNLGGSQLEVDHINHNTLDNRKSNLRICTHAENSRFSRKQSNNKSGYKGVCWSKRDKKWLATIYRPSGNNYIGLFSTPEEAAMAYDREAKILFGEFAYLNFPNQEAAK